MSYMVDTGVLLRAFDSKSADHNDIVLAFRSLRDRGESFSVTVQNLAEFWNVSTRPVANNGYGLAVTTVIRRIQLIERICNLYTESMPSVQHWKQLLLDHDPELLGVFTCIRTHWLRRHLLKVRCLATIILLSM